MHLQNAEKTFVSSFIPSNNVLIFHLKGNSRLSLPNIKIKQQMRKFLVSLVAVVMFVFTASAQNRTVTGTVTDASGKPVANASVVVKGTNAGTSTNQKGEFTLQVPANGKVLEVSGIGFNTITYSLAGQSTINATLTSADKKLDEVVVVAYGTVKKGAATSAVTSIKADEFKNRPLTNITSALEGAAPGIQVLSANGQPGSSQTIRLRGFGSINASNDPLFVVDGAIYNGAISNLNMDDVESVSVLKDAAASALYGSKAGNGVIIITTKKAKKGAATLGFKAANGMVMRGIAEYDRVGVMDYYPLLWQAYRNSIAYASTTTPTAAALATASTTATNGIKALLGYNPFNVANNAIVGTDGKLNPNAQLIYGDDLDWSKDIIRNGMRQEYGLNFGGSSDKSDFYSSFGYVKEQGFSIKSDLSRFTGRLSANASPVNWFKTGINIGGTMSKSNTAQDGTSTAYINPFNFIRNIGPIYPLYAHDATTGAYLLNANGNRFYDYGNNVATGVRPGGGSPGRHIAEETNLNVNIFERNFLNSRAYGKVNFTKDLDFTTNISMDITNYAASTYGNRIIGDAAPTGRASKETYTIKSYTFNQLVSYNKLIKNHNISFLAGHENQSYRINDVQASRSGQIFDGNIELGNFAVAGDNTSYEDNATVESYLSRLNYDYDGKYFVSGSLRRDGNSRFKKEFRWDNFWSVGLGWRIDKENFMKNITQISALKLRTSYGKVGNDGGIGFYPYQALYSLGYNNGAEPGVVQTNLKNDSLRWETSKNYDVALEFSLFNFRLNGSVEYYYKNTDGLIFGVPQPVSNGGTTSGGYTIQKNIGEMYNKGFEFHLDGDIIRKGNLTWNVGVNASTLKNQITKMPAGQSEIISGTKKLAVGHSIYDFWLREWRGVDTLDGAGLYSAVSGTAANSRIKSAGDTVTPNQNNAKFVYAGSAIPKVWGSITTNVKYKSFELSAVMAYQIGGKIYDGIYAGLMDNGTNYGSAQHADALKAWQKPGDVTEVPRMDNAPRVNGTSVQFNAASTRWLIDASYFNIRSLSLAYNLPKSVIARFNATSARVFVNGENLGLYAKRKGLNPQQSFTGVTSNAYPPSRVVTVGVNVNF